MSKWNFQPGGQGSHGGQGHQEASGLIHLGLRIFRADVMEICFFFFFFLRASLLWNQSVTDGLEQLTVTSVGPSASRAAKNMLEQKKQGTWREGGIKE